MKPYIYIFSDTREIGPFTFGTLTFPYKPFYVGMSRRKGRIKTKHKRNYFVNRRIRHMKREGHEVHVYRYYTKSINSAAIIEAKLVKVIGRRDLKNGPLLNLNDGGTGNIRAIVSRETRAKQRKAKLGKKLSREHKAKISASNIGREVSKETRKKLSQALTGRIFSDKTLEKMRRSQRERQTPEVRERMRQAQLGKKLSKDHRAKISASNTGHRVSKRTREKIGKGNSISQIGNSNRACVAYLIQYPNGLCRIIKNLAKFCRINNLPLDSLKNNLEKEREITKGKLKGFYIERLSN